MPSRRSSSNAPQQSGIRESYSVECLRCAAILAGTALSARIHHHARCVYTLLRRDPTRLELFAKLTPEASRQLRIGNYERLFDQARQRVRAWEAANVH